MKGSHLANDNRVNDDNGTLSDNVVWQLAARRRTAAKHTRSFDFGDWKIG
jgi:hypothetical protein